MRDIEQLAAELMRGKGRKGHFEIRISRVVTTRSAAKQLRASLVGAHAAKFDDLGLSKFVGKALWVAVASVPQPKYGPMQVVVGGRTYATAVRRLAKALREGAGT